MNARIAAERLANHRITHPAAGRPENLVAWLGAVQAQDVRAATWALALRMKTGATPPSIARSLDEARLVRTHVLRPTWHFVAAPDIYWMLELTASTVQRRLAYAYRYYKVDHTTRARALRVIERALSRGQHLTRSELATHLVRAGIAAKGVELALLTVHAELERVICSGARRGSEMTYALLADRVPHPTRLSRDEALAELTRRFLRSHGPATIRDFVWWCGLSNSDARRGLEMCGARSEAIDGLTYWRVGRPRTGATAVHLLPIYDEYLVAYRDLEAVPRAVGTQQSLVIGGQVAGTWRVVTRGDEVTIEVRAQRRLTSAEQRGLEKTVARYQRFRGLPVSFTCNVKRA